MEQIILNLVPGGVSPVCYVSQYDVGRKIRLHLRNGSDPYVLSGAETINATIRKVSGEELIYDIANTSASYVDLIVNYDATDVIGESVCELIITESGLRIGSANFKMRIDPDVYSGNQKLEVVTASSPNSLLSFETNIDENLLEFKAGLSPIQNGTPWIDSNEVNKEPYIKRSVAGTASRIGNHLYDKLVGGTVAFNQHIDISSGTWTVNSMTVTANNGLLEISGTAGTTSSSSLVPAAIYNKTKPIYNHKYLLFAEGNHNFLALRFNIYGDTTQYAKEFSSQLASTIFICNVQNSTDAEFVASVRENMSYQASFKAFLVDLTAMFSSTTIADYIYSLEQATAGAGVAFFKALFPNDYYAYNAGELMSVKATAHIMRNASNTVIGNYALDSNLELRGIPKLVNNKLEYDGDIYESNGNVTRRYGIVDLGSLSWETMGDAEKGFYTVPFDAVRSQVLTYKYTFVDGSTIYDGTALDKTIGLTPYNDIVRIRIKDKSYDNVIDFKNSLSGVYLVYELTTPTTESASPFTNPQVCDENGTEEYTDNRAVAIPVGHETYQANICPINGYTEANITRCGVNIFNYDLSDATNIVKYVQIKTGNGTFTMSSNVPLSEGAAVLFFLSGYQTSGSSTANNGVSNGIPRTVTTTDGYVTFAYRYYGIPTVSPADYDIQLEEGSTATAYTPYNGQTYAIAFGQTVYGGVLDVTRGKLTVTHTIYVFTGSETWVAEGGNTKYYSQVHLVEDIAKLPPNNNQSVPIMTSIGSFNRPYNQLHNYSGEICIASDGRFGISGDLKQASDTLKDVQVVYELATPFDIDLTPVQISVLVGENNVLSDTNGGMEIKYFRLVPRQ